MKKSAIECKFLWLRYKWFGIKSKYPCGRNKKTDYLCCMQPWKDKYVDFDDDHLAARCKVCDSIRMISSHPIDSIERAWTF